MLERLEHLISNKYAFAGVVILASILAAYVMAFVIERILMQLAKKTASDLDDAIVEKVHHPLVVTIALVGIEIALRHIQYSERAHQHVVSFLQTIVVLLWGRAALGVVTVILNTLSERARNRDLVQPRTLPLFDMVAKTAVFLLAAYLFFLAWDIDVTAWLASAGIVGIAVGFAAKDSLANLFAGVFIVADAPYQIGDWIVLDGQTRGKVLAIGIRSTRVLTLDDIEITIPNAIIGNSQITNEAGGPAVHRRIGVTVDAAYGSDIDQVREVLESVPEKIEFALKRPAPYVRFESFGASGLTHTLYLWIQDSQKRDITVHQMHTEIYRAFEQAGIEIPYSKHDVYIKSMPEPGLGMSGPTQVDAA